MQKQELGPLQKKWLAELRSGKWTQVRSALRDDGNGRCCLGVACDVVGCEWDGTRARLAEGATRGDVLPYGAWQALGLRDEEGSGRGRNWDSTPPLYMRNDRGESFAKIADTIEADPAVYFTRPK